MHFGRKLYSLILFLIVSALGGLLAAGLIVPAAGAVAAMGIVIADSVHTLPADLETPRQAERSRILNADGSVLTYLYDENRLIKPLSEVSEIMQKAQVAIEDHRFFEHGAIDLTGTLRALVQTSQGSTQGGSSITQQYVRLVQVEAAAANGDNEARVLATENTLARKVRELRYAIAMEERLSKEEILERYLNIAYYGDGAYGVEAAAQHYFRVAAKDLDLAQSAMLAGLVRNPIATNPARFPKEAIERRNNVLDRMLELNVITAGEAAAAKAVPWDPKGMRAYRNGCANSKYPFVCDYVWRALKQSPALGNTVEERENLVRRGGLTIQTHFDLKVQDKAEKQIAKLIAPTDPVLSVIAAIEPGTGLIVAMAQSRPKMGEGKGQTYYNYAADEKMGGAEGFFAGSTFKMFVAAAALSQGIGVNTTYKVTSPMDFTDRVFRSCDGPFSLAGLGQDPWKVSGYRGTVNMYSGVAHSVNGYFVQLEQAAGICESVKMARTLGLKEGSGKDLVEATDNGSRPSFTLGTIDITPLSMAEAYATIAARGVHCDPIIISSIKTMEGRELPVPSANCKQVISKDLADSVAHVFRRSVEGGTSRYAKVPGVQMAGKTGTVTDNRAVWQVAMTPNLSMAAVISYDSSPKRKPFWDQHRRNYLGGVYVHGTSYPNGRYINAQSGAEAGGLLLQPVFAKAMETRPHLNFHSPSQKILNGEYSSVPSCYSGIQACKRSLEAAGFSWSEEKVFSDRKKGSFVGMSPSGRAPKGGMIVLKVSKGSKPAAEVVTLETIGGTTAKSDTSKQPTPRPKPKANKIQ